MTPHAVVYILYYTIVMKPPLYFSRSFVIVFYTCQRLAFHCRYGSSLGRGGLRRFVFC